jgi:N-methylhydantoinase A
MLLADRVRDYAAGVLNRGDIEERFREMEARALEEMPGGRLERTADIRYAGQSYELNVPWDARDPAAAFHREHQRVYGYANPDRAVEVVQARVRARIATVKPRLEGLQRRAAGEVEQRRVRVRGRWMRMPALQRAQVSRRAAKGPALVLDYGATTLVPPGWKFRLDAAGNLILKYGV